MLDKIETTRRLVTTLLAPQRSRQVGEELVACVQALGKPWLHRQGVMPMVGSVLHDLPAPSLPPESVSDLVADYWRAAGDAELHRHELGSVLQALAAQSVRPVLFKGAALAYTVYADPACRPMGDLDLWLTEDEMLRAQAALEHLGYIQRTHVDRPLALQRQYGGEVQMIGTRAGSGLVELHWSLFPGEWLKRTACVDETGIRDRCVPVQIVGHSTLVLAPEDAVIQLAAHLAINHQMAFRWLRGLVDVALVARAQTVNWDLVAARARAWRVSVATWLVLELAHEVAGMEVAVATLRRLSPSLHRQWLLGRLVNARWQIDLRSASLSPSRFVYLLLLTDRMTDAARLAGRALWPERDWLEARYGRAGLKMQLRHLVGAARGNL